jgi:hypothetical protein
MERKKEVERSGKVSVNFEPKHADIDDMMTLTGFKIKILDEMIPTCYDTLRQYVLEELPSRREPTEHPPAIKKEEFW